jgi:hypothetical protein
MFTFQDLAPGTKRLRLTRAGRTLEHAVSVAAGAAHKAAGIVLTVPE